MKEMENKTPVNAASSNFTAADIPPPVMEAANAAVGLPGTKPATIIPAHTDATERINASNMTVPKDCTVPPELQRTLTHKRVPPDLHRDPRSVAAELASDWGRSRQLYEKVADVIGGMDEHDLARFSQVNANASVDILDIPALHGALEVPLDIPALNLKVLLLANLEGCHSKHVHATVNAGVEFFRKVLRDLLDVKTGRPQLPQEFEAKLAQLQGNCGNRDAHEAEGNYDEQDHFQAEVDHPTKGFRALMSLFMVELRRLDLNIKHDDECQAAIEADLKLVTNIGAENGAKLCKADRLLASDENRLREELKMAKAERKAKTTVLCRRRELQGKLRAAIGRSRDQSANGPTNANVPDPKGVDFIFGPQIKPGLKHSLEADLRALKVEHAANNDMQTHENEHAKYSAAFDIADEIAKNHEQSIAAVRFLIKTDQEVRASVVKAAEALATWFERAYVTRRSADIEAPGSDISATKYVAEIERQCKAVADIAVRELEKGIAIAENDRNHAAERLAECEEARKIVQRTTRCPQKKHEAKEAVAAAETTLSAAAAFLITALADRDAWLIEWCYEELVARRLSRNPDDPEGEDVRPKAKAQRDQEIEAFVQRLRALMPGRKGLKRILGWK